jgi:hypothetical protein
MQVKGSDELNVRHKENTNQERPRTDAVWVDWRIYTGVEI